MIITRAPFRVSFFGGGSDMKEFYSKHEGAVLTTSINHYMYIASHRFFHENRIRAKYSITETVDNVKSLKHPIIREVLRRFRIRGALEVTSFADVPGGTGLGSSSAFTVALLHNLHLREGNSVNRAWLAEEACEIEIQRLKEPIGKQDQYAVALGGINVLNFARGGAVSAEPLLIGKKSHQALQDSLMIFYTGKTRSASELLARQRQQLRKPAKVNVLREMVSLVSPGKAAIMKGDTAELGRLLHEGWQLKRKMASGVSNSELDEIYRVATRSGAWGGKVLGAGGGGFFLFCCRPERRDHLRKALSGLKELPFQLENQGATAIYVEDPEHRA